MQMYEVITNEIDKSIQYTKFVFQETTPKQSRIAVQNVNQKQAHPSAADRPNLLP